MFFLYKPNSFANKPSSSNAFNELFEENKPINFQFCKFNFEMTFNTKKRLRRQQTHGIGFISNYLMFVCLFVPDKRRYKMEQVCV